MTFGEVYQRGKMALREANIESPEFDASCLFEKAFGSGRQERIIRSGELANGECAEAYAEMIRQRADGRPLQYILGEWPFLGLSLEVGEGVLVPREETELLVRTTVEMLKDTPNPRVIDLCSGSGAVALGLSSLLPGAEVLAAEWFEGAYDYLERNIRKTGLNFVKAVKLNVLDPASIESLGQFDCIVSNPPYVKAAEIPALQREVRNEPREALDGGANGLDFYRAIAKLWLPHLLKGGAAAVEIGEGQAQAVSNLFASAGLAELKIFQDFNGIERVVAGRMRPPENLKDKSFKGEFCPFAPIRALPKLPAWREGDG